MAATGIFYQKIKRIIQLIILLSLYNIITMKNIAIAFFIFILLFIINFCLMAQVNVKNNGIAYISGTPDILFINGSFTNASGAAFTNNGNFYVKQDIANDQAAMAAGTGILYLNGTSTQTISGTQTFKTFDLVTNNTAGFTLNNNLSSSGTHTYTAGLITTSATPKYMIYESGSTYTGNNDSRHVNGWVKKIGGTDFAFPVGNATYQRTIDLTSLTASSEFDAKYFDGPSPNNTSLSPPLVLVDVDEYWTINKISGGSAIVTMNWDNSKVPVPQVLTSNIRAAYYNNIFWASIGGSGTGNVATTGSVTSNSVSAFDNAFTLGSTAFVLPLSIVNFTGIRVSNYNKLNWVIENEANVLHYELERSTNAVNFTTINIQKAKNNNSTSLYSFNDVAPMQNKVFYRLRCTDINRQIKYSDIVVISSLQDVSKDFYVIKNPVADKIDIYAGDIIKGIYNYTIVNNAGQVVQSGTLDIKYSGIHTIKLKAYLPSGIYMVVVRNAANILQKNILKE